MGKQQTRGYKNVWRKFVKQLEKLIPKPDIPDSFISPFVNIDIRKPILPYIVLLKVLQVYSLVKCHRIKVVRC